MVIGLLLAVLGGLGVFAAVQTSSHSRSVLVMARSVDRGQVIAAADLTVSQFSGGAGLQPVGADELDQVVGATALVDLPGGGLLVEHAYGSPSAPSGSAQLGIKLSDGRLPLSPLPAGTQVRLIEVNATGPTAVQAGAKPGDTPGVGQGWNAAVLQAPRQSNGDWLIEVAVASNDVATLAELAASGRLVIVRVNP